MVPMRRRSFFKSVGGAVLGVIAALYVPGRPWEECERVVLAMGWHFVMLMNSLEPEVGALVPEEFAADIFSLAGLN